MPFAKQKRERHDNWTTRLAVKQIRPVRRPLEVGKWVEGRDLRRRWTNCIRNLNQFRPSVAYLSTCWKLDNCWDNDKLLDRMRAGSMQTKKKLWKGVMVSTLHGSRRLNLMRFHRCYHLDVLWFRSGAYSSSLGCCINRSSLWLPRSPPKQQYQWLKCKLWPSATSKKCFDYR